MLPVFGYDDAPHGHAEVILENVRVPVENLILGEGRGFEIAQGRLGPGRIHHCMRTHRRGRGGAGEDGPAAAQRAQPSASSIADHSVWEQRVAEARTDIEMARLLCLKAADMMDKVGNKVARLEIAMIKVAAPTHGAEGDRRRHPGARRRRGHRRFRPRARLCAHRARCGSPTAPTRCTTARSQGSSTPSTPTGRAARERGDALFRREAGRGPPPLRRGGAGRVDGGARRGLSRARWRCSSSRAASRTRPTGCTRRRAVRPAAQAAGQAAALGPRGRPRIPA